MTTRTTHRGTWPGVFWIGLAAWILGFLHEWFRVSLWLLDLILIPVAGALYLGGFAAVAYALLTFSGSVRRTVGGVVVFGLLAVAMLVVNPGYRVAPKTWFLLHRPLFEVARHVEPGAEYYGTPLPFPLRFLSATGNVSRVSLDESPPTRGGVIFFPQWMGVPDDAGGYLYSPAGSPAGADLYGMSCDEPTDLGAGWWMCGM